MKLKSLPLLLLLPVLMLLLAACAGGNGQPLPGSTPASTQLLPIATPIPTAIAMTATVPTPQSEANNNGSEPVDSPAIFSTENPLPPIPTSTSVTPDTVRAVKAEEELYKPDEPVNLESNSAQTTDQQIERDGKQETVFWNERQPGYPDCEGDFKFSHQFANPEDVVQLMFGPGGHIEPHEHMLYWESGKAKDVETMPGEKRQESQKIQLYAPADIFRVNLSYANRTTKDGDKYIEWGGYFYTCDGHQLMLGHIGDPSDEILAALGETEPTCGLVSSYNPEPGCTWVLDVFIPSGTPIFKNSGYTGAFDFGLELFGLRDNELQKQPGYGYSITPWRVSSGRAVCPIEYFPEPFRSEYQKLLSDNMTGELLECGPFNQDVPGTAMGFWMPSRSPETPPMDPSDAYNDEWETMWLFESNKDPSAHIIKVGNNTFGLDYGEYHIATTSEGLVNRRWEAIKSGNVYCAEFTKAENEESEFTIERILIMSLSEDGLSFTLEAINGEKCGEGPWGFQGGEHTFYR